MSDVVFDVSILLMCSVENEVDSFGASRDFPFKGNSLYTVNVAGGAESGLGSNIVGVSVIVPGVTLTELNAIIGTEEATTEMAQIVDRALADMALGADGAIYQELRSLPWPDAARVPSINMAVTGAE